MNTGIKTFLLFVSVKAESIDILEPQRTPSYIVFVHVTWAAVSKKKKKSKEKKKVWFRGLI